ncbi:hypothetical protein G6F62_010555 [Rhizopus arrhizus]|nr:hypothetical protein G6F23_011150 [Rhizopus arrhizus]KAG0905362.1 hypothetical protein G6F33_012225 [Rhizopus arrhizus]KAG0929395.1 hypothetical protein G6F32_012310 [Rhizopus arrhizus]KAG1321894.1 hypothetical protein G6F62_010555 [Rhizopus arrhizus]KAG1367089.1 hypothetical protein G6F61_013201 [Rhizopus arrhizus]
MKDVSDDDEELVFDFLENIFRAYYNICPCKQNLEQGKATFSDLLIFPFLEEAAKVIVEEDGSSEADFKVG